MSDYPDVTEEEARTIGGFIVRENGTLRTLLARALKLAGHKPECASRKCPRCEHEPHFLKCRRVIPGTAYACGCSRITLQSEKPPCNCEYGALVTEARAAGVEIET